MFCWKFRWGRIWTAIGPGGAQDELAGELVFRKPLSYGGFRKGGLGSNYPGRLETVSLGDSHTGSTTSRYHYQLKEGRADLFDLDETYARTTVAKAGIAQTVEVNGRLHVINRHEWYFAGHVVDDPTGNTPAPCAISYPSDLETFDFSPLESCPGWTTSYLTNFDGQVVEEVSPSGQVTVHKHLFDQVEAQLFPIDIDDLEAYPNMDERMLAFWKKYWHLRYWFSNEYLTKTRSGDGTQSRSNSARFEPVFNHPVQVFWGDYEQEKIGYRYDYMDDGHVYPTIDVHPLIEWLVGLFGPLVYQWANIPTSYGMSGEEMFSLMGIPHAAANDLWPDDILGAVRDPLFGGIPWTG